MEENLEWLNNFLKICCSEDLHDSSEQLNIIVQILKERYIGGYRHRYSQIAALLKKSPYSEYSSDQFDMLRANIGFIEQHFDSLDFRDEQKESSIKLFDHLILEVDRINNIDRKIDQLQDQMQKNQQEIAANIEILSQRDTDFKSLMEAVGRVVRENRIATEQLQSIKEQNFVNDQQVQETKQQLLRSNEEMNKAETRLGEMDKKLNNINSRLDSFNTQSVTILSIFTAIVFAFTGGFTLLGNSFSNLANINRNESIMLISLVIIIGCLLLDIIYFLLNFIGKLSNVKFSGNCDLDCKVCTKKEKNDETCKGLVRYRNRHFLIKSVNICSFMIVTLLLIANIFFITPSYPKEKILETYSEQISTIPAAIPSVTQVPDNAFEHNNIQESSPTSSGDANESAIVLPDIIE